MINKENKIKVAYVEGRPASHPAHALLARSIDAKFHFVDFRLRYHDKPESKAFRRYFSWLLCAITFPKRKSYDVFLSEEPYFMLALMRKLGLLSRKKKLFSLLGTHTPYFINNNKYSPFTTKMFKWCYNQYDGFFCEGLYEKSLLLDILTNDSKKQIYTVFNGNPVTRYNQLLNSTPNLDSFKIVSIVSVPNKDKIYYKGLDIMLLAFEKILEEFPQAEYTVIGEYDLNAIDELLSNTNENVKSKVKFLGRVNDFVKIISDNSLYLHTARGEAWGIAVSEAMLAGLPTIVSNQTGTREMVAKVDESMVVELEVELVSKAIKSYFNKSFEEKKQLFIKSKEISIPYTEEKAVQHFKTCFYGALDK